MFLLSVSFQLKNLHFCGDNETFVTSTDNPVNIVHWSLHGGGHTAKALKDYPKIQRKSKDKFKYTMFPVTFAINIFKYLN